jgi:hypothetical protein
MRSWFHDESGDRVIGDRRLNRLMGDGISEKIADHPITRSPIT